MAKFKVKKILCSCLWLTIMRFQGLLCPVLRKLIVLKILNNNNQIYNKNNKLGKI